MANKKTQKELIMKCPNCEKSWKSSVVDTRPMGPNTIRRRRKCPECGKTWSTREIPHDFRAGVTMDEAALRHTWEQDMKKVLTPIFTGKGNP
jgi:transcriptional regulator NrdR family protein